MKKATHIVLKYKPGSKYPEVDLNKVSMYVGERGAVSNPLTAVVYQTRENAEVFQNIINNQGDLVEIVVLKITIEEVVCN